ncbi:ankyrin repeat domain-containing protein [Wolbachia endosymbiont of Ctenocephalides felis wCfeJ]|uniref:ankyrin repeat domain-containing protein n=1 Tax=Wolbachia endosymbiont of Ctenocephalides felis wCfeJ TaxID=2732594 RepID=UPI0014452E7F|nr:ankyrin repeat domain-containing protein [Wolbachia endosymbiont of Ctenocephalides felis wCfeJ]WCR58501.1 MAG: Phosphocholine transferase AnkX [Wolbachia endosymbiont of Ctenocephalides felis wCfeJ]
MSNEKSIALLNAIHNNTGDIELIQRLIREGADVNFRDIAGNVPLILAVQNGNKKVVDILLASPEIDVNVQDNGRQTPLHWAAKNLDATKALELVKALLDKGANVNIEDMHQDTPLHFATREGYENIVKELLEVKEICVNTKNIFGYTPLHLAANRGYLEIVKKLIKKGAYFDIENEDGDTPLDLSTEYQAVYDFLSKIKQLFVAVKEGNSTEVNDLIKQDIYINARNKDRQTPLNLATDEEIKVLLRSKRDVDNNLTNKRLTQSIDNDDIQLQQDSSKESQHPMKHAIKASSNEQLAPSTSGFILWSFWSDTGRTGENVHQSYIPLVKLNIYDYDSQNDLHLF